MIIYWFILLISLLFVNINADVKHLNLVVDEHKSNDIIKKDSLDQSSEKILIRVPRMNEITEELTNNFRERRDLVDDEYDEYEKMYAGEIWGMAKKVAITVFVLVSVSMVCCIVTIIYICMRCCCGGNDQRKRNQGFNTIPQPIIIHTNSPNYQQQQQQQAPPLPLPPVQTWPLENHPMLPRPSAPPPPLNDSSYMDRPPPYEKIYAS